jgi:hypothetical protein
VNEARHLKVSAPYKRALLVLAHLEGKISQLGQQGRHEWVWGWGDSAEINMRAQKTYGNTSSRYQI